VAGVVGAAGAVVAAGTAGKKSIELILEFLLNEIKYSNLQLTHRYCSD
jgi:hypothetical protein